MSTDLHSALRAAVADEPFDPSDTREVLAEAGRRARRRTTNRARTVGVAVAAVLVVIAAAAVYSDRPSRDPRPADVVQLDLSQAQRSDVDVLASARTTWRESMNDLDSDQFDGLTTDGLVLHTRSTEDPGASALGLLDPGTGKTDWLPPPPFAEARFATEQVVELTADRLVLFARHAARRGAMLEFDRRSGTWTSRDLRLPAGDLEVHVPVRVALGADGRFYLGSTYEGESGPMSWWSYSLATVGTAQPRPEPEIEGAVAWGDGVQALARSDGQVVVVSGSGAEEVVAEERPGECEPGSPELVAMPPLLAVAGGRPVVTYSCSDATRSVTVAYEVGDGPAVAVAGASLLAADGDRVLLASGQGEAPGVYLLDLDSLTLTRIGSATHDLQFDLAGDLVLWNEAGPLDDKNVSDVVWKVGRVPAGGD